MRRLSSQPLKFDLMEQTLAELFGNGSIVAFFVRIRLLTFRNVKIARVDMLTICPRSG